MVRRAKEVRTAMVHTAIVRRAVVRRALVRRAMVHTAIVIIAMVRGALHLHDLALRHTIEEADHPRPVVRKYVDKYVHE